MAERSCRPAESAASNDLLLSRVSAGDGPVALASCSKLGEPTQRSSLRSASGSSGSSSINSLFYLARVSGLSARASFIVAFAFSLLPQSIYFEHLYLYEEPVAALLCLSVALFHAALSRQSFRLWLAFFAVCAAIGVTRSTFHLIWLCAMLGSACGSPSLAIAGSILMAASAPATVLLALYVKNLLVFGTFSALHLRTLRLRARDSVPPPPELRAEWVREHRLSPFAALSPYAGPREYLQRVHREHAEELAVAAHRAGTADGARSQLQPLGDPGSESPAQCRRVVLPAHATARLRDQGGRTGCGTSSRRRPSGIPTRGQSGRLTTSIGKCSVGYEAIVNRLVHRLPRRTSRPLRVSAARDDLDRSPRMATRALERCRDDGSGRDAWTLPVEHRRTSSAISSAFTFLESSRYRYQVESLIWVIDGILRRRPYARAIHWKLNRKSVSGSQFS